MDKKSTAMRRPLTVHLPVDMIDLETRKFIHVAQTALSTFHHLAYTGDARALRLLNFDEDNQQMQQLGAARQFDG
jgi:hypothetical protein